MPFARIIFFYLLLLLSPLFAVADEPQLLPPDEAFKVSANIVNDNVELSFQIAEGYYLYQHRFSAKSQTADVSLGEMSFPQGKAKRDEAFGDVIIYRNAVTIPSSITNPQNKNALELQVNYQGCADIGVCYPPQKKVLNLTLASAATIKSKTIDPVKQIVSGFKGFTAGLFEDELLPAEEAFQFFATVKNENSLQLNWMIADGYYLYKEKVKLRLIDSQNVELGTYEIPHGEPTHDEAFGKVEIFHHELKFDVALLRKTTNAETIVLEADFQGCADRGVCYPPMTKQISLNLPVAKQITPTVKATTVNATPLVSEQNQIANALQKDTLPLTLLSFFGFGLLLSLTPCIFPMIPILSGIIVGQGKNITTKKAFLLSLAYVVASALTYTVFGILAALFGSNLQAAFQQTWVIALFSSIFILLSLSMFGFYHLELPKSLQAKLHDSSDKHREGSYLGAGIMGALSSLIVGPCVAAPLAGALIYIGQSGDVVLGGSALFVMGLGMGAPLLIVGASAGKLLPKAGHWLNSTKAVFGVIMLAVALWMLERILPATIIMLLWAILFIISSIYLHAIEALPPECSGWRKLWKGFGLVLLIYGVLLLVGVSAGNTNPLKPLQGIGVANAAAHKEGLKFEHINSLAELNTQIEKASANGQWVMFDFYADWCISCKEMEAFTFTDPKVKQRLKNVVLLQVDVTKNSELDKELLSHFNLIGPPAILFFGIDKKEHSQYRVIGYQDTATFLAGIESMGTI
ncbi:MAG: protein-disulfide reductase DsbD [Methylococcaceae bacterium]|nr:protein-disulfide reductase DsbD [Methylococcaceae bacterium]